jgi:L-arabonate dehydrase
MQHTGKALVFENIEDFKARIDTDELEVDETSILVLKNVGPRGYPGMPEVGNMGIPKKMLAKGVTRYGTHLRRADEWHRLWHRGVLHVSPEAAIGGNFAL